MKLLKFRDPIHFVSYTFVLGDWKLFNKEMDRLNIQYPKSEQMDGRMQFFGGREAHVFIFLRAMDYPTLAHEVAHSAIAVFEHIGANINTHSDENFAYYVQWIFGTIYHNMKKGGLR